MSRGSTRGRYNNRGRDQKRDRYDSRDRDNDRKGPTFTITVGDKDATERRKARFGSTESKTNGKSKSKRSEVESEWDLPERLTEKRTREQSLETKGSDDQIEVIQPTKKKLKKTENCRYFPNCENEDNCPYNHPTQLCNKFPNCPYESKCLFYHPKVNPTPAPKPLRGPPAHTFHKRPRGPGAGPPCRYGFSCQNRTTGCTFSHPLEMCRYGNSCTRRGYCYYGHGVLCKFGSACSRPGCSFTHKTSGDPPPTVGPSSEEMEHISSSLPTTPPQDHEPEEQKEQSADPESALIDSLDDLEDYNSDPE